MAGAATFASGITGISGTVSASNSLIGSSARDNVGGMVVALSNGDYVVASLLWNDAAVVDAGAVTFGSGSNGISGQVSSTNLSIGRLPMKRVVANRHTGAELKIVSA